MLKLPSQIESAVERGGAVVVPSRQRAHALRLAYAATQLARGKRVWGSPDALPLEGWLTREIERHAAKSANTERRGPGGGAYGPPRLLSPAEEWLLWRQCTMEVTDSLEVVNRASLAESLRRAGALAAELRIDLAVIREPAATEAGLLAAVYRAVMERSTALGAAPLGAALSGLACPGEERPVVFAGFLAASPRLRAIARLRAQQGLETSFPSPDDPAPLAPPRVLRPADDREELEHIAEWCRRRLTEAADARLLVLLPGSAGRRERLAALIRQAVDPRGASASADESPSLVAMEGGQPLASLPLVAHALTALALLSGEGFPVETLLEWLRAPWCAEPGPGARAALDLWIRDRRRPWLDLSSLAGILREAPAATAAAVILTRLEQAALSVSAASGTPREWSERFRAALRLLGWPGTGPRGSAGQQTLLRLHELLDELGQLSAAVRTVSLEAAVQWLRELASRTPYRPADADAPVTLSPVYADPVVRYDGVWVAGLDAERFPQPVAPDPFLPLASQVEAGWPAATAAGRLGEARGLLAAWRVAAAELVLSAPARAEDIDLLPSPLLEQWRAASVSSSKPLVSVWLPARLHRPGLLTEWRDDAGVEWESQRPLPSGTRSLELQNQCPFRAYAELRLGSLELGVPEPGVAPDARGQLLHAALQRLWERLGDSRALAALPAQAMEEAIDACIEEAAAALDIAHESAMTRPVLRRECRRAARLIRRLLDIERRRAPFRVRHAEYATRLRAGGQELRLRIDRIDALESGGVAILDYKSGARASPDWYGDRPSHPQLLAYLAAVGDEVVAMATVNVTAKEVRFDGIAASASLLPKVAGVKGADGKSQDAWAPRVQEWRQLVERLIVGFAAGHAAVDPKPGACDYCHVAGLCRVGDDSIAADHEAAEDGPGPDDE